MNTQFILARSPNILLSYDDVQYIVKQILWSWAIVLIRCL